MTPRELIQKWSTASLRERAGSHEHFLDICRMLDEPTPAELDPHGDWYTFDRGVTMTGSGNGWADVWKRGFFGWEYKSKHKDLNAAYAQLQRYAVALENPPLLVVSDMETFVIHTNFTNTVHEQHPISIFDLEREKPRHLLKTAFTNPEQLKPGKTRECVTQEAASEFTRLAFKLREAKRYDSHVVAHFLNKILFCLFAEDIGLLPNRVFTKLLEGSLKNPARFRNMAAGLFSAMSGGGDFGPEIIDWFNGGLFDDDVALPLDQDDIRLLIGLSEKDWSAIEPSIFGTLFERGLDPDKRSQLGAHYTDRQSIERIVKPVVLDPLAQEWQQTYERIKTLQEKALKQDIVARTARLPKARTAAKKSATEAFKEADTVYRAFLVRLASVRVLDPACGSGNFLYVALQGLHDLEHRVMIEAESLGLHIQFPQVGPEAVMGIEMNAYAAELSRVTIWIGEIQWMLDHGYNLGRNPILRKLDQIACRDALLNEDGTEAEWPRVDCIVGNPPFLGDKKMISELGQSYVALLRNIYRGRVPGGADLVTYWFEKARHGLETGAVKRAGLVATNSIRDGRSRTILDRVKASGSIFHAWSDEPWVLEGADVRVSLICFTKEKNTGGVLDGVKVEEIFSDLTSDIDLTTARPLRENKGRSYFGLCLAGEFTISGQQARQWLLLSNPHQKPNKDVLRPIYNGKDLTGRYRDRWVIDFGTSMDEHEAALYEAPFGYLERAVRSVRLYNRERSRAKRWWIHGRARPELRSALAGLSRYIATSETAKHRIFVWLPATVAPEHKLVVIPREDDATMGILSASIHVWWALAQGARLEDRPVYSKERCFETFPFPTPNQSQTERIAQCAVNLTTLRNSWLNPPEMVKRVPEVVSDYPDRLLPSDTLAARELKKRTLTNLYNQNPSWLRHAHAELDAAVAAAYGWPEDISDDEALSRLLKLNLERACSQDLCR